MRELNGNMRSAINLIEVVIVQNGGSARWTVAS